MVSSPAVSVVIPTWNATAYVAEALDSVFAQTFSDYEVIVVNDGCPDTYNLERVLEPYRSRIVYLTQANGGPSVARNTGVLHAHSPLIALLDADDVWLPGYLAYQVGVMSSDSSIALAYANMETFGGGPFAGRMAMDYLPSNGEATFEAVVEQRCIVLNCVTMRRDAVVRAGLWHAPMRHCEDFDLWLRIAHSQGRIVYTRTALARVRGRAESLSRSTVAMYRGRRTAYERALGLELSASQRELVKTWIARTQAYESFEAGKEAFYAGDVDNARKLLAQARPVLSPKQRLFVRGVDVAPEVVRAFAHARAWLNPRYRDV